MSVSGVFAQTKIVYAGLSFPRGDFADDDYSKNVIHGDGKMGAASTGVSAGFKYLDVLSIPKTQWFVSADFNYNGLLSDFKDEYEDHLTSPDYVKFETYMNIPVFVGLNYSLLDINTNASLWVECGLGANCRIITSGEREYSYSDFTTEYDKSIKFAYQFGAGLTFNGKYIVGLNFMNLGKDKLRGETTSHSSYDSSTSNDFKSNKALQTTTMTLRIGYMF